VASIAGAGADELELELPAIHPARSKFWIVVAGLAAKGLRFCISSNSALASGSTIDIWLVSRDMREECGEYVLFSRRYGMPTIIASENMAMRIIGFLNSDITETTTTD
jgi:hypothetical protein